MALRFFVAIALSALIGSSCGRPTTDDPKAEPGSSKAEPYIVYPPGGNNGKPEDQGNNDISFLYNWLKNHRLPPWKAVPENKPIAEPVAEPKPEPYYPYMPKVPPHTHQQKNTITHTRTDHHVLPPQFVPFPYGYKPFPPYGNAPRFQIPPFPYPPMKPIFRHPFAPVFGQHFFQQQQGQQQQDKPQDKPQGRYQYKPSVFPPFMIPGGLPTGPFLPPPPPSVLPPFRGVFYGQPQQGKFGGYATNVYNSMNNGNGMYNNRIVDSNYGFGGIMNSIKGRSSTPFLPKPYPFVPMQPKYGYQPFILN